MTRALILLSLFSIVQAQDRTIAPIAVGRKLALVVGNASYAQAPLRNPGNDATAMESALRRLGFQVTTARDLDLPKMEAVVDKFAQSLGSNDLAFFYYSGHGIQLEGQNYLYLWSSQLQTKSMRSTEDFPYLASRND